MEGMLANGGVEAAAICDPSPEMCQGAHALAPDAASVESLERMLTLGLDGIAIATPSALHADQAVRCLEAGVAVFCQKPLGRDAAEVARVLDAARRADRLLMADFSYRHTRAMREIVRLVRDGALGRVFAIDLVFHNAYGPDKPWFYDRALAGGGCLMDLGSHLVDLAHWALSVSEPARDVAAHLSSTAAMPGSKTETRSRITRRRASRSGDGIAVRLACSWRLHAGQDAVIEAAFYGTDGGAAMRNVGGSFYDFEATSFSGTTRATLAAPPDPYGARAASAWAERLETSVRFDDEAEDYLVAAETLDLIYRAACRR